MAAETPYAWLLLVGLLRVGVVALVAFVVLTRVALPGTERRGAWEGRAWGDAVLGVSVTLVVAFLLGLLGLFDAASLAAVLALALVGGATLRYRKLWRRTLLQRYARFLEWVERIAPPAPIVPGLDPPRPTPAPGPRLRAWTRAHWRALSDLSPQTGWWIGVGVASVIAVGVRLIPTLAEPAPFTFRYYASLETLKGLMVGEPIGAGDGWGLQSLVMALSEMARVDPALVMRGVGAVAAGAITYGVYQTARFYWGGRLGAFAGALFVAAGGPLLPLPLDRQAGAEPLMLAAALALPVFPHLAAYLGSGSRRGVTVGTVGLIASGLVYPAVGALLAAILAVYVATIVVQIWHRQRTPEGVEAGKYRNRGVYRRVAWMGGGAVAVAVLWAGYTVLLNRVGAAGSIFFFESGRATGWGGVPGGLAGVLGGLMLLAPFVPGRSRYEDRLPRPGALLRTGGQTLAMLALWLATGAQYEGLSGAAAVLLMTVVGVDVALLVGEVEVRAAPLWRQRRRSSEGGAVAWAPSLAALAVGVVVIVSGWAVPVPGPGVEPEGFVRGYHAARQSSPPYAWTAVSHLGTGVLVRHQGRFMDYEYFLLNYDPDTYEHEGPGAIPTPDVFLFVERQPAQSRVEEELLPIGTNLSVRMREWIGRYRARPDQSRYVSLFYQDEEVNVIRIGRSAPTLLSPLEPSPPGHAATLPTRGASGPR